MIKQILRNMTLKKKMLHKFTHFFPEELQSGYFCSLYESFILQFYLFF